MIDLVKSFMVSPGLKAQLLVPKSPVICKIILRLTPGNGRQVKAAASIHILADRVLVRNLTPKSDRLATGLWLSILALHA